MRHSFVYLFICSFVFAAFGQGPDADWTVVKGTHFLIYYQKAPREFIASLAERAEDYYDRIAEALGVRRFDFWLWENRAKIYVYDSQSAYQSETGQPGWSGGCALIGSREKTILCFPGEEGLLETVLPHEMGHIIFKEFVGFSNPAVPFWLDEGVASLGERSRSESAHRVVRQAMADQRFMDLKTLFSFNPYSRTDADTVALFYSESISLVDFLIREFGREDFVVFCQNLRDKKDFERALVAAYPFNNMSELDQAWQKHCKNE